MKKLARGLISIVLLLGAVNMANAQQPYQNPKWGTDSTNRMENLKNFSLYREFVKQKNYKDAFVPWKKVFEGAPKASKNIYIDGAKIIDNYISKTKDATQKEEYINLLMKIYDQRMEVYGRKSSTLGRKAASLAQHKPNDIKAMYDILEEAIKVGKAKTNSIALVLHMQATKNLFSEGKIDAGVVMNNYTRTIDILDKQLEGKRAKKAADAKANVNKLFEETGAASCEKLIEVFTPKFEASPEDQNLLELITRLMDMAECTDKELFFKASENLHRLNPSARSAYNLAKMSRSKGDFQKASKYFLEAIEKEENQKEVSQYYIQLGDITYREIGNLRLAKDYAYKAAKANPESGHPYVLLGSIYANAKNCGDSDFHKKAVYWLAVDKFVKAKKIEPQLTEQCDRLINAYKAQFPKKEEIFFNDLKEGQTYKIECWINENTTVRKRK